MSVDMSWKKVFRVHDGLQFQLRKPAPSNRTCLKQSHHAEDILQQLSIRVYGNHYRLHFSHPVLT